MNDRAIQARVAAPQDEVFLEELFFEIRSPEFILANLPETQLRDLLAHQYTAMRSHYARVYPEAVYWILEREGQSVGYEVIREGDEIHLIDIAVRSRFQNQGIGTSRMRRLLDDAASKRKSVILSVEIFNPARRLYDRLGFQEYEDFGIYKRMRWSGVSAAI